MKKRRKSTRTKTNKRIRTQKFKAKILWRLKNVIDVVRVVEESFTTLCSTFAVEEDELEEGEDADAVEGDT